MRTSVPKCKLARKYCPLLGILVPQTIPLEGDHTCLEDSWPSLPHLKVVSLVLSKKDLFKVFILWIFVCSKDVVTGFWVLIAAAICRITVSFFLFPSDLVAGWKRTIVSWKLLVGGIKGGQHSRFHSQSLSWTLRFWESPWLWQCPVTPSGKNFLNSWNGPEDQANFTQRVGKIWGRDS